MKFVLNENLFRVGNKGYVGVSRKQKVELGSWYYEPDNHIPIYYFTKDTLPDEYYLNKILFTDLYMNAPRLALSESHVGIKEIELEDDVEECSSDCEQPDIWNSCNDGCINSRIVPRVVDGKVIVKNIVYDDTL